jgi:DNA-binding transcriptional ArsR family regulator
MSKDQPTSPEKQSEEEATLTSNALKAMANPLRWRIICALGSEELSVNDIMEKIGTSQSNTSQHLDLLRSKNIIKSRKEANKVYYSISNNQLLALVANMRSVLCQTNLED